MQDEAPAHTAQDFTQWLEDSGVDYFKNSWNSQLQNCDVFTVAMLKIKILDFQHYTIRQHIQHLAKYILASLI